MNAIFCQMKIFKASPGAHRIISYDYKKIKEIKKSQEIKTVAQQELVFQGR